MGNLITEELLSGKEDEISNFINWGKRGKMNNMRRYVHYKYPHILIWQNEENLRLHIYCRGRFVQTQKDTIINITKIENYVKSF